MKSTRAELINRYLLGELSDEEKDRLEGKYFADPELLDEVHAARDELIDTYLCGELSPGQSESFERYFMASPRRRERVGFAKALMQLPAPRSSPRASGETQSEASRWQSFIASIFTHRQMAFTAAALLLIAAGSWVAFRLFSSREQGSGPSGNQLASVRPEQSQPTPGRAPSFESAPPGSITAEPIASPTSTPTPGKAQRPEPRREPQVATFILTPGLLRGEDETERLVIPRGAHVVLLRFGFEGGAHKGYRASLRTPEGVEVPVDARVRVRETKTARTATLRVLSASLKDGDYILRLSGTTEEGGAADVAKFYFRVERK